MVSFEIQSGSKIQANLDSEQPLYSMVTDGLLKGQGYVFRQSQYNSGFSNAIVASTNRLTTNRGKNTVNSLQFRKKVKALLKGGGSNVSANMSP